MDEPGDSLTSALARHAIELPPEQIEQLDRYRELLWMWNQRLNLTRHTDFEKFVTRDVVDTLALERFLDPGERVLDVGTGGGVPGVTLAIVRPDLAVSLCESVAKKARAVAAIVSELGIPIETDHTRAEQLLAEHTYDTLVARAVAPLYKLAMWFAPYWDSFRQLLVIKGPSWIEERNEARERGVLKSLELRKLLSYETPGTGAESVVLRLRPKEQG